MKKNRLISFMVLLAAVSLPTYSSTLKPSTSFTVVIDTVHKYFNIKMKCIPVKDTLSLMLPVWTPGCYTIMDFPRQLTDFCATDIHGNKLPWNKRDKANWLIPCANADTVTVSYRIYGDVKDATTGIAGRIISTMAFMMPASVFMYQENQKEKPVTVHFDLPSNWKYITTPLQYDDNNTVTAQNIDELYDSPFLIGNQVRTFFNYDGHHYEMTQWEGINQERAQSYIGDLKKLIQADKEIMGDIPYDKYCYLFMYGDMGSIEHANCQTDFVGDTYFSEKFPRAFAIMVFSHEYFHLYNVKRIHPIELGPFDYQREVYCPTLWFSEGITHYYTYKSLCKAGITTPDAFYSGLSDNLERVQTHDGRKHMSLRQSGLDSWLNSDNENGNADETTISFYFKGSIVGLLMDIHIINATNGQKSLDDVMRKLYAFCTTTGRGFTEEELWHTFKEVCGETMDDIRRYVDTTDEIDYEAMLAPAGLTVDRATWSILPLKKATARQIRIRNILTYQNKKSF